jgi:YbbR domain-containing protein
VRLPGFVRRNWKLKVLCFFIAFVTWVGVVYAGNPPETKLVSVPIPQSSANIPAGFVLVHPVNNVQARVGGSQNTLDSLDPAVLVANVDWAAVNRVGTYSIPVTIINSDSQIELIDAPTSLQVDVDRFASVSVPVTIEITNTPPVGYVSGTEHPSPSTVAVRGPAHELSGIKALVAVNLSNQKANFEAQVPVFVYDASNRRINDLGVSPQQINVSISITAYVTTRTVAVVAKTTGSPSPGRYLLSIEVTPFAVVATAPQDLLNSFLNVSTVAIPIGGITGAYTESVNLVAPAGVTLSVSKVTVTIEMGTLPPPPTSAPTPTPTPTPSPSPT